MKTVANKSRKNRTNALFETLENRQLMSVSPLVINGTAGNDVITVNYGTNLVVSQQTAAAPQATTSTTTTTAAATSASRVTTTTTMATRSVATTAVASQAVATAASTAAPKISIVTIPTIFNTLTYTVDGVSKSTTLQAGQIVVINGLDGADKITVTGKVTTQINGGDGNDTLIGGTGADQFSGGSGIDTVDYSARTANLNVSIDGIANDGQAGEGDNVETDVEIVYGGWGNDILVGNANDTVSRQFYGGYGNDSITGGAGADQIYGQQGNDLLTGGAGNDLIHGGAGDDIEHGGTGDDIIYSDSGVDDEYGEAGNDRLYGGTGASSVAFLYGGDGDDIMVSIGGSHVDRQWGGAGNNSFWLDSESTECVMDATAAEAKTNVHRVANYEPLKVGSSTVQPGLDMYAGNLPDPVTTVINSKVSSARYGYANFSSSPLFSTGGPVAGDINQGQVGDCYFLAALSATAKVSPNVIKQSIVDLGDGTFAVQLRRNGVCHYVRVDADLPVDAKGNLEYAHWGVNGNKSLWAPLMEKAWAFFRNSTGTYDGASSGNPVETFKTLGMSNDSYNPNGVVFGIFGDSPQEFGNKIQSLLSGGNAVTLCTPDSGGFLVNSHCYMVDHVTYIGSTVVGIVLRNPWGYDGTNPNHDSNTSDGYITLDATEALASCDHLGYGHA